MVGVLGDVRPALGPAAVVPPVRQLHVDGAAGRDVQCGVVLVQRARIGGRAVALACCAIVYVLARHEAAGAGRGLGRLGIVGHGPEPVAIAVRDAVQQGRQRVGLLLVVLLVEAQVLEQLLHRRALVVHGDLDTVLRHLGAGVERDRPRRQVARVGQHDVPGFGHHTVGTHLGALLLRLRASAIAPWMYGFDRFSNAICRALSGNMADM